MEVALEELLISRLVDDKFVSILVLMEVALEVRYSQKYDRHLHGFNPCFNGSCFGS